MAFGSEDADGNCRYLLAFEIGSPFKKAESFGLSCFSSPEFARTLK
jgi:hypothetical protein